MAELHDVIPVFAPHIARLTTPKDEKYKYRWVSMDPGRVEFLKEQYGYEVVNTEHTMTGEAGPKVVGNSILMRCPREQYEKREATRRTIARQRLEAPRRKVKDTGEQLGVEVTDQTREYRAPMSTGMQDVSDKSKGNLQENTITREQVDATDNRFNPNA